MSNGQDWWNRGANAPTRVQRENQVKDAIDRGIDMFAQIAALQDQKSTRKLAFYDRHMENISEGWDKLGNKGLDALLKRADTYYKQSGGENHFEIKKSHEAFHEKIKSKIAENNDLDMRIAGWDDFSKSTNQWLENMAEFDQLDSNQKYDIINNDAAFNEASSKGELPWLPKDKKGNRIEEYRAFQLQYMLDEVGRFDKYMNGLFIKHGNRLAQERPMIFQNLRATQNMMNNAASAFASDGLLTPDEFNALNMRIKTGDSTSWDAINASQKAFSQQSISNETTLLRNSVSQFQASNKILQDGYEQLDLETISTFYPSRVPTDGEYIKADVESQYVNFNDILNWESLGKPEPNEGELAVAEFLYLKNEEARQTSEKQMRESDANLERLGIVNALEMQGIDIDNRKQTEVIEQAKDTIIREAKKNVGVSVSDIGKDTDNQDFKTLVSPNLEGMDWVKSISDEKMSKAKLGNKLTNIRRLYNAYGSKWVMYYYEEGLDKRFGELPMNAEEYSKSMNEDNMMRLKNTLQKGGN